MTERYPWVYCADCKVRTNSMTGLCKDCRPARTTPPIEVRCGICGVRTRRQNGICQICDLSPAGAPTEADRLTGGRWVSVDGIQRWRPWTAEECAERTRQALRMRPTTAAFDELQQARKRLHALVNEHRPATKEVA